MEQDHLFGEGGGKKSELMLGVKSTALINGVVDRISVIRGVLTVAALCWQRK